MGIKDVFVKLSGTILNVVIAFAVVKIFMAMLRAKSNLVGQAFDKTKGLTNKAREFGQSRDFYQRRQLARDARKNERRRGSVANYAETINANTARGALLRRRAAGGALGQVFNTNQAGQERIRQSAEDMLLKEQKEEAHRAGDRMRTVGLTGDASHVRVAATAAGQQITAPNGQAITVTEAMRQAAINNLAAGGRVKQLRALENNDAAALIKMTGDPSFAATADLSVRGAGGTPRTETHTMLDRAYAESRGAVSAKAPDLLPDLRSDLDIPFTGLKPAEVATFDPTTIDRAAGWFSDIANNPNGNQQRLEFIASFNEALTNPQMRGNIKADQLTRVVQMLSAAPTVDPAIRQGIIDAERTSRGL